MEPIHEAAERVGKNGYSSTIEMDAIGPTGFVLVNGGTWDDVTDLADLAVTLLDPEPIDEEWLEAVGGEPDSPFYDFTIASGVFLCIKKDGTAYLDDDHGSVIAVPTARTRGAVRTLCLALGITLNERGAK